jgi:hypothetical protein
MDYRFPVLRYAPQPDGIWRCDLDAGKGMTSQFFTDGKLPGIVVGQPLVFRPLGSGFSQMLRLDGTVIPKLPDPRLSAPKPR